MAATPYTGHSLKLERVRYVIGHQVLLQSVSTVLTNGEMLRISGDNGSGKSTLLRVLTGLIKADGGRIYWDDTPIGQSDSYHGCLCFIGHRDGIKLDRTVEENVRYYQHLRGGAERDIHQLMFDLDLLDHADLQARYLSFGQKRRLALIRLMLSDAVLWVLDEPFTGIDANGRESLQTLFHAHLQSGGMIVLTHHGDGRELFSEHEKRILL